MKKIILKDSDIEPYFYPQYVPKHVQEWIQNMLNVPNIQMSRSGEDFVYNFYDEESDWQVIYVMRVYAQVRARRARSAQ
jgi:hypothetical protein